MKYKLTDETIEHSKRTLHRIQALKDFGDVKAGELGGYIESEKNLSQEGDCWVSHKAKVFGNAKVFHNALVCNNAWVSGDAWVFNEARVFDYVWVYGEAQISGHAGISGKVEIFGDTEIKNGSILG